MARLSRRKLSEYAAARLLKGDTKTTVLRELAAYLIETRRRKEAQLIVRDIESVLAREGAVVATVTSARPLESAAKATIEQTIKQQYSNAHSISLREEVDESLIGGVKIELPDAALDMSVKAKLEKLTV